MSLICELSGESISLLNTTNNTNNNDSNGIVVVITPSGHICRKDLLLQKLKDNGNIDPFENTNEKRTLHPDDLIEVKQLSNSNNILLPPRSYNTNTNTIPNMIQQLQNEYNHILLELYNIHKVLEETKQELSVSLYHNDAAIRVIARITNERDIAIQQLQLINTSSGSSGNHTITNGTNHTINTTSNSTTSTSTTHDDSNTATSIVVDMNEPNAKKMKLDTTNTTISNSNNTNNNIINIIPTNDYNIMIQTWNTLHESRKLQLKNSSIIANQYIFTLNSNNNININNSIIISSLNKYKIIKNNNNDRSTTMKTILALYYNNNNQNNTNNSKVEEVEEENSNNNQQQQYQILQCSNYDTNFNIYTSNQNHQNEKDVNTTTTTTSWDQCSYNFQKPMITTTTSNNNSKDSSSSSSSGICCIDTLRISTNNNTNTSTIVAVAYHNSNTILLYNHTTIIGKCTLLLGSSNSSTNTNESNTTTNVNVVVVDIRLHPDEQHIIITTQCGIIYIGRYDNNYNNQLYNTGNQKEEESIVVLSDDELEKNLSIIAQFVYPTDRIDNNTNNTTTNNNSIYSYGSLHPDGLIYVTSEIYTGNILLWDFKSQLLAGTLKFPISSFQNNNNNNTNDNKNDQYRIENIEFSNNGYHIAVSYKYLSIIHIWDLRKQIILTTLNTSNEENMLDTITSIKFDESAKFLAYSGMIHNDLIVAITTVKKWDRTATFCINNTQIGSGLLWGNNWIAVSILEKHSNNNNDDTTTVVEIEPKVAVFNLLNQ